jgi:hypothetical protein
MQSIGINHTNSAGGRKDYGVALITNSNTSTVSAVVPLFVNLAVDNQAMALGVLSSSSVSTVNQTYTVNSNNNSGITLQIDADAAFDDGGGNTINDVADGTVTAGSEEYGISNSVSGLTLISPFDAGDDPVPTSATSIADSNNKVTGATLTVTYKASIDGNTVPGTYDQLVTMTVSTK